MYVIVANDMVFGPFDSRIKAIEYALRYWKWLVVSDEPHVLTDYAGTGMAIVMALRPPIE